MSKLMVFITRAQEVVDAALVRARVIAASVVTWLTLAAALAPFVASRIAEVAPDGVATTVTRWAITLVAVLNAAIAIIRRVTPVPAEYRGVVPPAKDVPPEFAAPTDLGAN